MKHFNYLFLLIFHFVGLQAQIPIFKTFNKSYEISQMKQLKNGRFVFIATDSNENTQIWSTDGTAANTKKLSNFCGYKKFNSNMYSFNNTYSDSNYIFGIINSGCSSYDSLRIYKTDGITFTYSTQMSGNFKGGLYGNYWEDLHTGMSMGNKIYFIGGMKSLYSVDKTTLTISLEYGQTTPYTRANDDIAFIGTIGTDLILYFDVADVIVRFNTINKSVTEIYKTSDYYKSKFNSNSYFDYRYNTSIAAAYTYNAAKINGKFVFRGLAYNGTTFSSVLWVTDGTAQGTKELIPFTGNWNSSMLGEFFTEFNNKLYFRNTDLKNSGLWVTDGTPEGTKMVKKMNLDDSVIHYYANYMSNPVIMNGKLYFLGQTRSSPQNMELWQSDGTLDGTIKLFDFYPNGGLISTNITYSHLFTFDNKLYFTGEIYSYDLMCSDGTLKGTYSIGKKGKVAGTSIFKLNDNLIFASQVIGGTGCVLNAINYKTARPLLLNVVSDKAIKGQKVYVSSFDLKGAENYIKLYLNDSSYISLAQSTLENDTLVSFIIPESYPYKSFKVMLSTNAGMFVSQDPKIISISGGSGLANEFNNTFSLYPIPASDLINISLNEAFNGSLMIKIYNQTGQVCYENIAEVSGNNMSISPGLASGIYVLEIHKEGKLSYSKIIIE